MKCELYGITKKNGRESNQDFCFFEKKQFGENMELAVLGVCDGMGGMEDGADISHLAALNFQLFFWKEMIHTMLHTEVGDYSSEIIKLGMQNGVRGAQKVVCAYMNKRKIKGGTTLTAAVIWKKKLFVMNVGDSPCYLLSPANREVMLTSKIENRAYQGLEAGLITDPNSKEFKIAASYLTNYVGSEYFHEPEVKQYHVFPGDKVLIGSDGAFGSIQKNELNELILCEQMNMAAEQILLESANRGEHDNQTLVMCRIL